MAFSQVKYDKQNTQRVYLKLNKQTDADILDYLSTVDNKQGLIKELIREHIQDSKIYNIEELKHIIKPIAEQESLNKVVLFGSYARNQATAKSDIDLCVDFPIRTSLLDRSRLVELLKTALGKDIDVVSFNSLNKQTSTALKNNIESEGIIIYGEE